jgi:hypothetical protein
VSAVFTAFREDFAFPSGVFGPVENWEFAWFAASWDEEMVGVA